MTTYFKQVREDSVMCTVQGCSEVAVFFAIAAADSGSPVRSIPAAYCHSHAEDAARRLGHPWPISEQKEPAGNAGRQTKSLTG